MKIMVNNSCAICYNSYLNFTICVHENHQIFYILEPFTYVYFAFRRIMYALKNSIMLLCQLLIICDIFCNCIELFLHVKKGITVSKSDIYTLYTYMCYRFCCITFSF